MPREAKKSTYFIGYASRPYDLALEFAQRVGKPCAITQACCASAITSAEFLARGLEFYSFEDWEDATEYMTVLRARKVMKDSKILAATRMTSTVSVSAPDSIIDPEKITERFGTRIRYVSAHELLDQISYDDPMENYCTPGRKGLNLTAEDEKIIDKETDELIAGAEECEMTREMVKKSVEANYGIQKFLDAYECNCFTAPCPDLCATRRLNQKQFTMCLNHSLNNEQGIPSACEYDLGAVVSKLMLQAIGRLTATLDRLSAEYRDVVKIGRTHLQDAVPLTLGQEISGWSAMLGHDRDMIVQACRALSELALGGTAVGTGLNAPAAFGDLAAEEISELLGYAFLSAPNKFHALTSKDQMVFAHGALKALAADLMKIANDVRWLASGPRCGIGELIIPANEPGSSIMPGKVNPTQCEAVTMVAVQVMGNDTAIGIAASQGNFQLNVFLPVTIYNFLQSARLLADAMDSFEANCVRGIRPNYDVIQAHLDASLMLVTALTPHIGYERAAEVAKLAHREDLTLRESCLRLGYMTAEAFDAAYRPEKMV